MDRLDASLFEENKCHVKSFTIINGGSGYGNETSPSTEFNKIKIQRKSGLIIIIVLGLPPLIPVILINCVSYPPSIMMSPPRLLQNCRAKNKINKIKKPTFC